MVRNLEKSYKTEEEWRRSIPAQVFLNHFFGIHRHIEHMRYFRTLDQVARFRNFSPELTSGQEELAKRMLVQAWNTEYVLRKTAENRDETFHRNALYWTFPQAYYSIFFGAKAFLAVQGGTVSSETVARMRIGRLVTDNWYPASLAFGAIGYPGNFTLMGLPAGHATPALHLVDTPHEWQAQVGQFLRTTRTRHMQIARQRMQANPETALRTKSGKVSTRFGAKEWREVARKVSPTTFLDLFARLKISSTHREIERFLEADIDFRLFHMCLFETVRYINSIHEAYVAKAMGEKRLAEFKRSLPEYLRSEFDNGPKGPEEAAVLPLETQRYGKLAG
jgi:hypothetical protein